MAEREDWTLFRTIDGLQQKAGVAASALRRLVLKEIADNALDTAAAIHYEDLGDGRYVIEDEGCGIDGTPEEIADLFSIRRPMRSSKLLRLPQRGALGNGLRVVAGAVLASEGSLVVATRNRRIVLKPMADGTTKVVKVTKAEHPVGTRIEIGFGAALPDDEEPFAWVEIASRVAGRGKAYEGHSSLILAHGTEPVRALIANLDGCTGGKAGEIVVAAGVGRKACQDINRHQASQLLTAARRATWTVRVSNRTQCPKLPSISRPQPARRRTVLSQLLVVKHPPARQVKL